VLKPFDERDLATQIEMALYRHQTDRELRRAKVAAENANVAKTQFLANMSHELRTPLTAIMGYVGLLQLDPPAVERQSYLAVVQRNAQVLLQLINDVLDLSRVEAGLLTVQRQACDPRQVVAEVLNLFRLRADEKGLPLAVEYRYPLPDTIQTDPVRLRQILLNLVGNAVKFTAAGGVSVELSYTAGHPCQLSFAVADTGIGIEPALVETMFEPFTQADSAPTRRYGGSGLGLTICRRLADLLGGRITVESQLGQGSTFTLALDLDPAEQVAGAQPQVAPVPSQPPDAAPPGKSLRGRVLLAEDAPDNRELMRVMLTRAGVEVDVADDGALAYRQALASAAERRP
jgi:signal transduction histidine kinase